MCNLPRLMSVPHFPNDFYAEVVKNQRKFPINFDKHAPRIAYACICNSYPEKKKNKIEKNNLQKNCCSSCSIDCLAESWDQLLLIRPKSLKIYQHSHTHTGPTNKKLSTKWSHSIGWHILWAFFGLIFGHLSLILWFSVTRVSKSPPHVRRFINKRLGHIEPPNCGRDTFMARLTMPKTRCQQINFWYWKQAIAA